MTTTAIRPPRPSGAPAVPQPAQRRGPLVGIVIASLVTGAVAAAALVLGLFPGAPEHVTTGVALFGFATGWAMLAFLSARMTSVPQRWAYGLAAFLGISGLALLTLAPDNDGLTAAAWVWPPALLVLVIWAGRRMRDSLPGRSRWLLYPVLGALSLASIGALVQNITANALPAPMAMPGVLHDVGGHRLHLHCSGRGTPTVVLESGLHGNSALWTRIADSTAATTRVCTYDRAGTGWSEDASGAQDSKAVVTDLHQLLSVSGEAGPYVLVGHSTGGVYALTYSATYPEQVAGVVLLDAASPHQFTVLPQYTSQFPMLQRLYGAMPSLLRLSAGRLVPALSANDIPGDPGKQAGAFAASPRSARTARDELSTYRRSFAQAQALATLGAKPLVVVSASQNVADTTGWLAAQQEMAVLSSNADHRIVDSTHVGLLDHPVSSIRSVAAIHDVVQSVRTGSSVAI
jgi:pimeloyl-ACP methyl ester carboxylesterase